MDDGIGFFVAVVIFIAVVIGLPVMIIRGIDHHYSAANCPKYGQQYNRETKFADYNYFSYECLAKTSDGKGWLPVTQLRDVND